MGRWAGTPSIPNPKNADFDETVFFNKEMLYVFRIRARFSTWEFLEFLEVPGSSHEGPGNGDSLRTRCKNAYHDSEKCRFGRNDVLQQGNTLCFLDSTKFSILEFPEFPEALGSSREGPGSGDSLRPRCENAFMSDPDWENTVSLRENWSI